VACPTCRAAVGQRCKRPSGHPLFGNESHATRMRAAGLKAAPRHKAHGRIPDNLLCFPDPELAAERQAQLLHWSREEHPRELAPPLRVPGDPPSLGVGTSLQAYLPLPEPIYQTELGRLFCGESQALMPKLEPGSVDLCFTSPPYALLRKKQYGNQDAEDYVAWFLPFVHHIRRLLKPSGFFVLNLGPAWEKGQPVQSTYDVQTMLAVADRLHAQLEVIWHKAGTLPGPAQWVTIERIRLTVATERVWVFSKDPDAFDKLPPEVTFDTLLQIPNKDSNSAYHRRCRQHGVHQHPARFPPRLPAYFIERLTQPGDLVLDPFGGSNTTGHVAETMRRRWTSIELDPAYCRDSWLRFSDTPLAAGPRLAVAPLGL
jgi:DNA modification methylase